MADRDPDPPRHINHDLEGADISDCPACAAKANAMGLDW